MKESYNLSMPTFHLLYSHLNNMYGESMRVDPYSVPINDLNDDHKFRCILKVEQDYPIELHETHKDIPICPEQMIPPTSGFNNKKILTTLHKTENYKPHYRNFESLRVEN